MPSLSNERKRVSMSLRAIFASVWMVVCPGCANYQLGTGASLDFSSIYVPPVENAAAVPQAVSPFSRQLRTAFIRDGRVSLATSTQTADVSLAVELVRYGRENTAVLPDDTALARKFDISLTARASLLNQRTGQTVFADREFTVTRQIFVDDGQLPAEYQVISQLADELADRISHAVLDVW